MHTNKMNMCEYGMIHRKENHEGKILGDEGRQMDMSYKGRYKTNCFLLALSVTQIFHFW